MKLRALSYVVAAVLALPGSAFALTYSCPATFSQQSFTNTDAAGTTTGSIQSFAVPAGVTSITIDAAGAQGGSYPGGASGGLGAEVTTTASVAAGQTLCLVVGTQGATSPDYSSSGAGGGGGTFVYAIASGTCAASEGSVTTGGLPKLLVAAAGGGGAATSADIYGSGNVVGTAGLSGKAPNGAGTAGASSGVNGDQPDSGAGGTGGNGGASGASGAGGGGGLTTDGGFNFSGEVSGGFALVNGAAGGTVFHSPSGGFGAGGSSFSGGGGGGGYNGGGGGGFADTTTVGGGGGGGSYSIAAPVVANTSSGANLGNGAVNICYSDRVFYSGFE